MERKVLVLLLVLHLVGKLGYLHETPILTLLFFPV